MANLFAGIPSTMPDELIEVIAGSSSSTCRVERIVSTGHSSPKGYWYDQQENEWVVVLKGEAKLRFEDDDEEPLLMKPGDWVAIPAHKKHRVEWTTPVEPTVWLAVFWTSRFAVGRAPRTRWRSGFNLYWPPVNRVGKQSLQPIAIQPTAVRELSRIRVGYRFFRVRKLLRLMTQYTVFLLTSSAPPMLTAR